MSDIKKKQQRLEKIVAAKFRHEEITDLDDLISVLQEIDKFNNQYLDDVPNRRGEIGDKNNPPIDYRDLISDLPVFGVAPDDTGGIWSWDDKRYLIDNGDIPWDTVDRKEWDKSENH